MFGSGARSESVGLAPPSASGAQSGGDLLGLAVDGALASKSEGGAPRNLVSVDSTPVSNG